MSHFREIISNPTKYLNGEQRTAWMFKTTSPMLIRGGAGSGKTIVAMLRALYAKKLLDESPTLFGNGRVAFLTYDRGLSEEVAHALSGWQIDVMTIDSWVYRFLKNSGDQSCKIVGRDQYRACMRAVRDNVFPEGDKRAIAKKPLEFYEEEFSWMKGFGIDSEAEYLAAERTALGGNPDKEDRKRLWSFRVQLDKLCAAKGLETFEDRVLRAWHRVKAHGVPRPMQYDHVVIDEAQDFTLLKLRLASAMTSGTTSEEKGMTIVADVAQEIYQSGFSWRAAGLAIVGRTRVFRQNYRNTRQIAAAAYSLLAHENPSEELTEMDLPQQEGPRPQVWRMRADDPFSASNRNLEIVEHRLGELLGSRVIATWQNSTILSLAKYFKSRGFKVNTDRPVETPSIPTRDPKGTIYLRTLHHMKGLQFDHVFLWDLTQSGFDRAFAGDDEKVSLYRRLVYVGMTRACKTLTICCPGTPSRFVNEIAPETVITRSM